MTAPINVVPTFEFPQTDDPARDVVAIAVGGHEVVYYDPQNAIAIKPVAEPPFDVSASAFGWVDVHATAVATHATLSLEATYAEGSPFTAQLDLTAEPVASVVIGVAGYRPLGAMPATFFGLTGGDIRLLDATGKDLIDTTLQISGPGIFSTGWDTFAIQGAPATATTVDLTAASFRPTALPLAFVDHLDQIELVDVPPEPNSYWHSVCAHALTAGVEVATTWSFKVTDEQATSPDLGNCIDVIPDTATTIEATARDGSTATLVLTAS